MFGLFNVLFQRVIQAFAPVLETSAVIEGEKVIISVTLLGATEYTPLTATLDGSPVTPTQLNPWQWSVEVPDTGSSRTVAWEVSATNDQGTTEVTDDIVVPSTLEAPVITTNTAVLTNRTLTVTAVATGNPSASLTVAFTVAGTPTAMTQVSNGVWTYTFPGSGSTTAYDGTVTAANGVSPNATYNFSGSVPANGIPAAFTSDQWTLRTVADPQTPTIPAAFAPAQWNLEFVQPQATVPNAFVAAQWNLTQDPPDVEPPPSGTLTAPQNFTATKINDRAFTLTWTAPSGGTPTRYDGQWRYTGQTTWNTVTGITSPYRLDNLPRGGSDYDLRVLAVDGSGSVGSNTLVRTTDWRPYGLTAEWNIPITEAVARGAHPNETYLRDVIWQGKQEGRPPSVNYINLFNRDYTYAVYRSSDATTTATCNVSFGNWRTGQVPWNPAWTIPDGTDAQFVILDETTGVEYNAWQVVYNSGPNTITPKYAGSGRVSRITANADETGGAGDWRTKVDGFRPSRGCGVQYYAMLITPEEIAQGKIYHALSCVMRRSGYRFYTRPAYKGERYSGNQHDQGVPQGTRFWFDVTDAEIDAYINSWPAGVPTSTRNSLRTVFRAMRDYGVVATDQGGDNHIQFQHDASVDWGPYGLTFTGANTDSGNLVVNGKAYPRDAIDNFISNKARIRFVLPPDGQLFRAEWGGDTPFAPVRWSGDFTQDGVTVDMTDIGEPLISGGTTVGSTLTITQRGQFVGEHPVTVSWVWQRNGVNISGTNNLNTYVRQAGDAGASIRVRFTATNSRGSTTWDSNAI